jgi:SAM-dependent methyltransferase
MNQTKQEVIEVGDRIRMRIAQNLVGPEGGGAEPSNGFSRLRQWIPALKQACQEVGQMPPMPPTLRGKVGAFVVAAVRRVLFWLIPPLRSALFESACVLEEQLSQMERMSQLVLRLPSEMRDRLASLSLDFHARLSEQSALLQDDLRVRLINQLFSLENTFTARLKCEISRLDEKLTQSLENESTQTSESLRNEVSRLHGRIDQGLRDSAEQIKDWAARLQAEADVRSFQLRRELGRELSEESRRITRLLQEARKRLPEPFDQEQLKSLSEEFLQQLDMLYLCFEDVFRGSRADIQRNLEVYIPYLEEARAGERSRPVLDLGCGRGEWLELLRERHFHGRGVDWNRAMVSGCRERQLDVERQDVLEYLRSLPASSLGAVTGFHIVEHLAFEKLIEVLDEVTRVLKPGGIAIFETPNPENVLVGSYNFYIDPTHRNPIPAATLRFLVEARGLCPVQVLFLHPCPESNLGDEGQDALTAKLSHYFYGPQDYAVVARKV